jgi:hypothetical protein
MKSSELAAQLAIENSIVTKLTRRDLRAGTGPSAELKAATSTAKATWRSWCNARDAESGHVPKSPSSSLP